MDTVRILGMVRMEKSLIKLINIILGAIVVLVPFFYLKHGVYPYTQPKTLFFQILVEILFFGWLYLAILNKKYWPKLNIFNISLFLFLGALIITTLLSQDVWRSFWGTQERATGVSTLIHFVLMAMVLGSVFKQLKIKLVLYASIAVAALISIVAMIQLTNPNFLLIEPIGGRPGANFGNPSFLAGYLIFNILLAGYYLFLKFKSEPNNSKNKIEWGGVSFLVVALVLMLVALFQAQTRGAIIGLGISFLTLASIFIFRPPQLRFNFFNKRSLYIVVLGLIVVGGSIFWITREQSFWQKVPGLSRFADLTFADQSLQPRVVAAKAALSGYREKPIFGWGWDNFNLVFNKNYDPDLLSLNYQETRFDKPHNAYLEYLVTGGSVLTLAYLFLIGVLVFLVWKIKDKTLGSFVLAMTVGYLIQNIFLFDTIGTWLMFFLITGLVGGIYYGDSYSEDVEKKDFRKNQTLGEGQKFLGVVLVIAAIIPIYFINWNGLRTNHYQFLGFNYFVQKNPEKGLEVFKKAIQIWTPWRWNIKRDYAAVVAENYFYGAINSAEEVKLGIKAAEEVAMEHPKDAYNHYILVDMYNQVAEVDKERYLDLAEKEGAIALELSPDRQQVIFSLAKTKSLRGDNIGAMEMIKKGLDLNPNVADGHFYYGLLAYVNGESDLGYKELKEAIRLGRKWKSYNDALVVANFFADSGHLPEAIEIYKEAVVMEPDNLEIKIKLGIAYFYNKQYDLAKEEIGAVMQKFDLRKSDVYDGILPILNALGLRY
jgi:O-antigen ligase/tetratricopeptide (TPR) repeat protein